MFKTILCTVDLTHEPSWKLAPPKAVELARASKAKLIVMTAIPDFGAASVELSFPSGYREKLITKGEADLEALIAREVPADIDVAPHLGYGHVHEEVLAAITKTGADLIVMASHAPDRVREFFVGSQADRVVRRSPISVLVVRK